MKSRRSSAIVPAVTLAAMLSLLGCDGFVPSSIPFHPVRSVTSTTTSSSTSTTSSTTSLFAKKKRAANPFKKSKGKASKGGGGGQPPQEKKAVKEARQDAALRQFMFSIIGLSKTLPDKSKTLLKNINLCFYPGAKIGVVGLNGSGKSTLLKIMAGLDAEFEGTARPLPGASIGHLPQEPTLGFATVGECVDAAVAADRRTLEEFNELSMKLADPDLDADETTAVMAELERANNDIDARDLWELDRTVERAMDALRLPPRDAATDVLSGGEKRRVNLCQLLLRNHDMLLLDEPTNHLDAESVAWLERFLDDFAGTVVCITHDRYFLENVAKWILELDRGEGIPFEGNYSDWLEAKNKRLTEEKKQDAAQSKMLAQELEWIRSNPKAKGNKSKARLNRYDELLTQAAPRELRDNGSIYIPPGPRLGEVVVDAKGLRKAFGDRLLMDDVEFSFPQAGIVGVVGPNGAGKSTLVKMIMGKDVPSEGTITVGSTVHVVGVGQERMDELDPAKTVYEEISGNMDEIELGGSLVNSRAYTSWFGFRAGQQQAVVGNLSGGERNRVQLAKLLKSGANLIILDEPTNDLDVETLRSLEEALLDFAGCAVVVSHDRYFLDRVATHILACEGDSRWHFFEGNYAEYEENRAKRLGETSIKRIKYAPLVNA